ncbi:MAG TPA: sugar phosphate isomerase/epimerase [Polyangiaceae bacterium]|nr:sugar phosphate isomerase/epimerase [Polyangiaceae bacterium]
MTHSLAASPSVRWLRSLLLGSACLASFACGDSSGEGAPADGTPNDVPADGSNPGEAPGERHLSAIGVQLYTVRAAMQTDFEGTLRRLADMGYREVEFAGLFGHDPAQVKSLLAELNLTAVGSHVDWNRWRDDPTAAIDETLALGAEYLVFPWTPDTERLTLDQWHGWAALINEVAAASNERGLPVAYHNHDFEFTAIDGALPYDVLVAELDPALVSFELDLYWLAKAGGDASALFASQPGRFPLAHVKDLRRSDQAIVDVGAGDLDFAAIFAQSAESGMRHFIVEHDNPTDAMQTAQTSIDYLEQLTY